jgi:hypothetical protein
MCEGVCVWVPVHACPCVCPCVRAQVRTMGTNLACSLILLLYLHDSELTNSVYLLTATADCAMQALRLGSLLAARRRGVLLKSRRAGGFFFTMRRAFGVLLNVGRSGRGRGWLGVRGGAAAAADAAPAAASSDGNPSSNGAPCSAPSQETLSARQRLEATESYDALGSRLVAASLGPLAAGLGLYTVLL